MREKKGQTPHRTRPMLNEPSPVKWRLTCIRLKVVGRTVLLDLGADYFGKMTVSMT